MDKVVLRTWEDGSVIALWPAVPANQSGTFCQSYEHIGQHGAADYNHVIAHTKPHFQELAGKYLWDELIEIGYNPILIQRATPQLHKHRKWVAQHSPDSVNFLSP